MDKIPFDTLKLVLRNVLLGVTCLGLVSFLSRGRLEAAFRAVEGASARFAARKGLAIGCLFFGVLAVRVALLPRLPVPTPGVHDEFSYLLLGDTLAHGRLANPTHPMWASFDTFHELQHPVYASIYPPGQGFVLALGQAVGNPWIGVLLSEAAMCAAILWMLQAWLPPRWALLGGVLAAVKLTITSYWMNSFWGGAVAAAGGALLLGGLGRILKRARVGDALLLGFGLALLANSRPFEGFFFALPSAVYFLAWLFGRVPTRDDARRRVRAVFLPVAAVLGVTAAFVLYYNWRVTGNPLLLPHLLYDRAHTTPYFPWQHAQSLKRYGNPQFDDFYNEWEMEPLHETLTARTLEKGTRFAFGFLWSGVLLILPALLFVPARRKTRFLIVTFIVGAIVALVSVFSFNHYVAAQSCIVFALLVQAVRHLRALRGRAGPWGVFLSRVAVLLLVAVVARHAGLGVCDQTLTPCRGEPQRAALREQLERTPGKHLVLVKYGSKHNVHREWVFNGADIDGSKVLFARDLDPAQNDRLLNYFSDRQVWKLNPDVSSTGDTPDILLVRPAISRAGV